MQASELVALCSAHGIDFLRVSGGSNADRGPAAQRRRAIVEIEPGITEASRKKQRIEAPDTAKGNGSRVARAASWGKPELAIAAYGTHALHWAAVQHSIASDRTPETLRVLFFGLRHHANKHATEGRWEMILPGEIRRDPKTGKRIAGVKRESVYYLEQLCMLVLDQISFKRAFDEAPNLYAIYMGVEQVTWDEILEPRFRMLQSRYAVWYGSGLGRIQRRINGETEQENVA